MTSKKDTSCQRCMHPPIFHRGGTGDSWSGWCEVTDTPYDWGHGKRCRCDRYVDPLDDSFSHDAGHFRLNDSEFTRYVKARLT